MDPLATAEIGKTGLRVTRLGMGGAPLGGLFADVAGDVASQTVRRALKLGVRYFDTAPLYGHGKSERFMGEALSGVPRDDFVISSKVGRVLDPVDGATEPGQFSNVPSLKPVFDYSRDGVLRSLKESLQRLRLERVDIALIHDVDVAAAEDPDHWRRCIQETYPTLHELRSQGVVRAIGAGLNNTESLVRLAQEGDFDCFLPAGRYTLLDQSGLDELLPLCERRGISVVLGGPYNSGVLASDLSPGTTYFYSQAPPEVLERARRIKSVCDRHGVPLKAAALQFGLAHPAVAATVPGARSEVEIEENVRMAGHPIPNGLWADLKKEGYLPDNAPVPSDAAERELQ